MDLQTIEKLTRESVSRLTSEQYLEAFNDQTTGKRFAAKVNEIESAPRTASTPRANGRVRQDEPSAPAPTPGFDPSFDEVPKGGPSAAVPVAAPAAAPVAATEEEEKVHSYQPVDRSGKPVGGKQVFKYRTQDELIQKLTAAHMASSARIRELSRDRKLDSIAAAGKAPRTQPEKEIPTTVEGLAAELRAQRESNFALSVRAAVNEFQASVDWAKYRSNENAQSVILAVERAGDDPTDPASYQRAFLNMQQFLEPVVPATAAATVEPIPAPAPAPVVAPAAPKVRPATTARLGTGLNNDNQFSPEVEAAPTKVAGVRLTMPDGTKQVMTLQEWNRQSSEFQKRVLRSSANTMQIEALYDAEDQRKAAARGGR